MPLSLQLETFGEQPEQGNDARQNGDFTQGYDTGYAEGVAAANAQASALNESLVQSIADINFTYAEARAALLQSVRPLITTIIDQVLPQCVHDGFTTQIAAQLIAVAQVDSDTPLTLHIHPDQVDAITAALGENPANVTIGADANLTDHAAWIGHGDTETVLDADTLLAEITDILATIHNPEHRMKNHG